MIVELRDGTVIEDAQLLGASNGGGGMQLLITGLVVDTGAEANDWYDQNTLRTIHFDVD